jgi:hypothetical protein
MKFTQCECPSSLARATGNWDHTAPERVRLYFGDPHVLPFIKPQ